MPENSKSEIIDSKPPGGKPGRFLGKKKNCPLGMSSLGAFVHEDFTYALLRR